MSNISYYLQGSSFTNEVQFTLKQTVEVHRERYSSTLSLTLALNGGEWSTPRPDRFTPGKRPVSHCIGGWVGPSAGVNGCGNLAPTGIRSRDRPARSESLSRDIFANDAELKTNLHSVAI